MHTINGLNASVSLKPLPVHTWLLADAKLAAAAAAEAAVSEPRQEEGADPEAAGRAGRVYLPQEANGGRAGREKLWLSGVEDRTRGDERSARERHTGTQQVPSHTSGEVPPPVAAQLHVHVR